MSITNTFLIFCYLIYKLISPSNCSLGDRLTHYRHCVSDCVDANCSSETNGYYLDDDSRIGENRVSSWMRSLAWSCHEECKYQCQWNTINFLIDHDVPHKEIPQFNGKWTFIRIFGFQEPASAIFSLMNLCTNFYGWIRYKKFVHSKHQYYNLTLWHTILAINAWFWSTIFHARDLPLTEKLDYFSAYSVVIFSLCYVMIRIFDDYNHSQSESQTSILYYKNQSLIHLAISMPLFGFFIYHMHYLFFIHFDYGYNMKINIATGITSSIGWLYWSYNNWNKGNYVKKCGLSIILLNLTLVREVNDFPPIYYTFDAHSIWHLLTVPIPLVWYSFLIDDALQDNALRKNHYMHVKSIMVNESKCISTNHSPNCDNDKNKNNINISDNTLLLVTNNKSNNHYRNNINHKSLQ